jgi:single-strand DNA-binding protein
MRGINRVILVGNLGKDPDLRMLDDGTQVAKMSLATTEIYRLKDGSNRVQTVWHQVVAWRGLALLAGQYLHRGSLVYIEGKIRFRQYEDGESQKRYVTEILADQILMLDKKATAISPTEEKDDGDDEPLNFQ